MRTLPLLAALALAAAAQERPRPLCTCKPREVGPSGSRVDWSGYRKGIDWHYSVDEATRLADYDKKLVFWFHLAGDLDKEGC